MGFLVLPQPGGGADVVVGASLVDLGAGASDGAPGLVRLGTSPDIHEVGLTWDSDAAAWRSEPITVATQSDVAAMDLGNYKGSDLTGGYSLLVNALPSALSKSYALLDGAQNLSTGAFAGGTGVLTVNDTTSPHSTIFPAAGTLYVRDNFITYTGKTATTFTGCTLVAGTGGTMPDDCDVTAGSAGGFGMVTSPVPWAGEMWDAGFRLEERVTCQLNAAPGPKTISAAAYWTEYDADDGVGPITTPVSGGMGISTPITSGTDDGTGGTKSSAAERSFFWAQNDWTAWAAGTPTKRWLQPRIVARMEAGAVDTGQVHNMLWQMRWVGTP